MTSLPVSLTPQHVTVTGQPLSTAFLRELVAEFPRFLLVPKSQSLLSWTIDKLLRAVTLGGQSEYLTTYYTVIGSTLYCPPSWDQLPDVDRLILLRHERVHLRQRRRLTFLGMAFVYLVPFFPLGLAYGRARLEWEAYEETVRATAELKGLPAARGLRPQIVRRFVGPAYGFMWPFPSVVNHWYGRVIAEIELGQPGGAARLDRNE